MNRSEELYQRTNVPVSMTPIHLTSSLEQTRTRAKRKEILQQKREAKRRREAGEPPLAVNPYSYNLVPVVDVVSGKTTYEKERVRIPFQDVMRDPERPAREEALGRSFARRTKRLNRQVLLDENHRENFAPIIANRRDDIRNPNAPLTQNDVNRIVTQGRGLKKSESNPWISHVRKYAKAHGVSYWDAIKDSRCKTSYRP
jgi:hypothetical protein